MSTGTSTKGPMTAANASPELIPKTAMATAIASSKLSLADMVYDQPRNAWEKSILPQLQNGLYIPSTNIYSFSDYVSKVREAGFEIIDAENITSHVRPYFRRWAFSHPLNLVKNRKIS